MVGYCTKRIKDAQAAQSVIDDVSRDAEEAGTDARRGAQDLGPGALVGDVAIVGVPGEFFTMLGQEIKRRSPLSIHLRLRAGQRLYRLYP